MTKQVINVGAVANDGTGDQNRAAWIKVNANFDELYNGLIIGQCQFAYVDANTVRLNRFNGSKILIGSSYETIPGGGVSGTHTGLVVGTTYYVYAYMNAGVMTLEFATTVPVTDGTYGHQIKTADTSRTLVGLVRPTTGPLFIYNSATNMGVRTWFNDPGVSIIANLSSDTVMGSGPYTTIDAILQTTILLWSGENVTINGSATVYDPGGTPVMYAAIGVDGSASGRIGAVGIITAGSTKYMNMACGTLAARSSAGIYSLDLLGGISGGSSPRYVGGMTGYIATSRGNGG